MVFHSSTITMMYGPINIRLASVEIKFYRRAARFTLFGHKRNEEILVELKVEPVDEKLRR